MVVLAHVSVHDDAAPVEGSQGVAREGVHGELESLGLGVLLGEVDVLAGQGCLARHVVGVHALPSSRDGASVEYHLQAVAVGVAQDVFVESHGLLLVASEEVDLDAHHADALEPFHLALAGNGRVHAIARTLRCVVAIAVGVVPEHQLDALRLGISAQLGHALAAYLRVPEVVHQAELQAHGGGQVDELHLVVVVDALVLPDEPAPGVASGLVGLRGLVERLHHVVGDGGLDDGLEGLAHGDGAPGCLSGQGDRGEGTAHAVVLALHGEGNLIALVGRIVAQVRGAILAAHAGLADEYPHVGGLAVGCLGAGGQAEEAWEGVALSVARLHVEGLVGLVVFLIAGLGALPSGHGVDLWAEERGGLGGQLERGFLLEYVHALGIVFLGSRNGVAEGDVVVRHAEGDRHAKLVGILELHVQPVGLVADVGGFHAVHPVVLAHGLLVAVGEAQVAGKVADVGAEAQLRALQHGDALIDHLVLGAAFVAIDIHLQLLVGRADLSLLSHQSRGYDR